MSSNAIQAVKQFSKTGAGYDISVTKEIVIGITLGLGAGAVWKSWHINSKRKINEYYEALDHLTKEKAESGGDDERVITGGCKRRCHGQDCAPHPCCTVAACVLDLQNSVLKLWIEAALPLC
eukprot:CAMPEP_0206146388 /NCGR_PEP_ID=MMETSP1473-20131121/30171_1 /ASSEMBLY_ACC=CAM_ASM_001109 /TAXON_ID=1461547 /ORGANISM="Stichococcus sp, Strain RCC1054" /LENGTH=121 /DNA_ID=CAMNT_0053542911 /DNA_START=76 /DNA_END=442 /DNA_ORIENTATION=-